MPFVLGDLAAVAFAGIAFLLSVAAAWLVFFLDGHIPNPGVFGVHPLGFIHGFLDSLGTHFVRAGEADAHLIRAIVVDTAHAANRVVAGITSVLVHHAAQMDHIAGTLLTGLGADLVNYADGKTLAEMERAAHAEGTIAASAAAAGAVAAGAVASIGAVKHGTVEGDISASHDAAVSSAKSYTDSHVLSLQQALNSEIAGNSAAIGVLSTAVSSTLPAAIAGVAQADRAALDAKASAIMGQLAIQAQALQDSINSVDLQLQGSIAQASQAAATVAAANLGTAEGYASAQAAAAAGAAAQTAAANLSAAKAALQVKLDATNSKVAALQATTTLTIPGLTDVSIPGEVTVPLAVAGLASVVAAITAEMTRCMITACDETSPNNLTNALRGILATLSAVGEIGFLAEAVRDPLGTASVLAPVLDTIDGGAVSLLNDLLSL